MTEKTTENDLRLLRIREWFPRKFLDFPCIFRKKKIPPVQKAPRGMVILYRLLYLSLGILVVFC